MRKFFYLSLLAVTFATACKSKKQVTTAAVEAEPNEKQLTALRTKMPNSTMEELQSGHTLFHGAPCAQCHGIKDVTKFDEERLQKTISKMSKKAHLTDVEKDAVLKYALAVNLSAKK